MFRRKPRNQTTLVDSTLNQYRPTLTRGPGGQWQLTVEVREDTFVRASFAGAKMTTQVLVGRTIHAARPANYKGLAVSLNVPVEEIVTAIIERWRFLNLIVELQ